MALIYADATSTSHAKVKTNVTVKAPAQKQSCAAICKQKNDALIADDIEVTKPFIKTEQMKQIQAQGNARKDRGLHNLFFCDEPGCAQIFEDQKEYMNSIARETYTTIKNCSKTH